MDKLLEASENALDFWTRCKSDPLDAPFPGLDVIKPGEPLEIVGSSPTGKTELALTITLKCILPTWCGGEGKKALFIDNDFHLNLKRLVSLISLHYQRNEEHAPHSLEEEIYNTLDRLVIFHCNDHYQFYQTLISINDHLQSYLDTECPYKLLVIDSISSFYWNQKLEESIGISAKDITNAIVTIVSRGQVIVITTGWKGGKGSNEIKLHTATKLTLDFVQFKEGTLISQVVITKGISPHILSDGNNRNESPITFFMQVSQQGCAFTEPNN